MTAPQPSVPTAASSRARQALILSGVTLAAVVTLALSGWSSYESSGRSVHAISVAEGAGHDGFGAAWQPVVLRDVTALQDPLDDPLPEGARLLEAIVAVDPREEGMRCGISSLAEAPSRALLEHRPGAVPPRTWAPEAFASLADDVERTDACDPESSGPAELRGVFLVPGDVADELLVSVDVVTDTGRDRLRFAVPAPRG